MKTLVNILCALAALCSSACAQTPTAAVPFEIKGMRVGSQQQVYVDEAWKKNGPVIEAQVRTNEDLQGKKPFLKAYFYDKDKKLIFKTDRPSEYTEPGKGSIRIPDYLKPKESYKVCFGITAQALDVHHKWSRVLVVFGEGNRATVEIYPPDDASAFEFDEKAFAPAKKK